jgi:diguanylate cyclase (GGDEF)-like protein/PAS domain S-box-containing protein
MTSKSNPGPVQVSRAAEAFESILNGIAQPIIVKDRAHRFVFLNDAACILIGRSRAELIGRVDYDFIPKKQADFFWAIDDEVFSTGQDRQVEERITAGDGTIRTLVTHKRLVALPEAAGEQLFIVAVIADVTELRRAETVLRESEEHYRNSVELNPQIPWTADPQGNIIEASTRWHELTGILVQEALGRGWVKALHPDDLLPTQQSWLCSVSSGTPFDAEYRLNLTNGSYRWFRARATARRGEDGTILRWYGTLEDIHERKLAEDNLRHAAYHDDLTGLPNRRLFQERLRQALTQAASAQRKVGLLLVDLDGFKQINDTFGHDAGDAVLKAFARRLQDIAPDPDCVARLGGDEFSIILPDIESEADITRIACDIVIQARKPLTGDSIGREYRTSAGGAISSDGGIESDELQKQADLALYSSKGAGPGLFRMFKPAMREEMQQTASALRLARQATKFNWIVPFYQPKVALGTGAIAGFEALLRWRHPRLGLQAPSTLAPAFDDPNLGIAIGERMLSLILEDLCSWLEAGLDVGSIAINASASEFLRGDYAERVLNQLRLAGLPASCLELEVTETVFLGRDAASVEHTLRVLSAEGMKIALDDFGTGYASLSHLKKFPVNVLKLDQSFVGNLENDTSDAAIVQAVVNLGKSLGIRVVAEGVETSDQAALLWKQGCDLGQGYLFSRPMPAEAVPQFIRSWLDNASWRREHRTG